MESRSLAQLISLIFNPPIVAAPTFLILIFLRDPPNALVLGLVAVLFGSLIPLSIVFGLSRHGTIPDIWASKRESRLIPFLGAELSYLIGTAALLFFRSPAIITALMLCYAGNTLIMLVISLKWKISIHATGITGPATALIYALGAIASPFLLLVFPVGWARLRLKAHTPAQVVVGALLTVLATWIQLEIYTPHL